MVLGQTALIQQPQPLAIYFEKDMRGAGIRRLPSLTLDLSSTLLLFGLRCKDGQPFISPCSSYPTPKSSTTTTTAGRFLTFQLSNVSLRCSVMMRGCLWNGLSTTIDLFHTLLSVKKI